MKTKVPVGIRSMGVFLPRVVRQLNSPEGSSVNVHVANNEEPTYRLGQLALQQALDRANLDKNELKHFIHCYDAPGDFLFQLTGRKILDKVGVGRCTTYNVYQSSNCSLLAIKLLIDHLRADDQAMIGGVSSACHWEYHSLHRELGDARLGDGAAVALLEKGCERLTFDTFAFKTIGKYNDVASIKVGGFQEELNIHAIREGRFVYTIMNENHYAEIKQHTVSIASEVADRALQKAGLTRSDLSLLVIHSQTPQVSQQFIDAFEVPTDRVVESVEETGYMCSAGLLISLEKAVNQRRLAQGNKILVTSIGIDGNWSAAIVTV